MLCENSVGGQTLTLSDNIQYGFCAGSPEPLYLAYLHYEPWPLLMIPGEEVSVLAHIEIFQEIPVDSTVSVEIVRVADGVNISIPCSQTSFGDIGSCDYDGNSFLNNSIFSVFPAMFCESEKSDKFATSYPTPRPTPSTPPPDNWAEIESYCRANREIL